MGLEHTGSGKRLCKEALIIVNNKDVEAQNDPGVESKTSVMSLAILGVLAIDGADRVVPAVSATPMLMWVLRMASSSLLRPICYAA